jgi:diguanylate cyclase
MPVQRIARTATVVASGAYLISLVPGVRSGPDASTVWDVGVYTVVPLLAAVSCFARSLRIRRDRVAWLSVGAGLTSYAAGTLVFNAVLLPAGDPPYPSVADGLWLALYPCTIIAVGVLVRTRISRSFGAVIWLDGLVAGLGLASVFASLAFPSLVNGTTSSVAEIVVNFAYPVLDLALVITAVGAVTMLGAWRDHTWLLLGAGFLTYAFADSWYLVQLADETYHPGSLVDFGYIAAATLVALASRDRSNDVPGDASCEPQSHSFAGPGTFALLAIGVLAANANSRGMVVAVVLAVGALTAAWIRTALTVREVIALSDSRRQARTDALTGLPNRRAFYEVLEAAEEQPAGTAPSVASIMLADLDRFKEINNAVGHQLGDQLLRKVSQRFSALVPGHGMIARLGGDEFALFVPGLRAAQATELSKALLGSLDEPFWIKDLSLHLTASIGITELGVGTHVSHALAKADLAMYRAKAAHTGCEIYDDESDGDAWNRLSIGEDLRKALYGGQGITVEFQPICRLPELAPTGLEALVRWTHPTRGRLRPDQFLPLAEKAGLMSAVTRTVLNQSLDEARRLRDRGWELSVSVNLSASDLLDDNLLQIVELALAERNLPGRALRIEITESLLVDTGAGTVERLFQLRALGVDLAVDDYGTGYSCLAYLHDLPVSYLKIDRSFVNRMLKDERTALIVASTIEMAHGLGLRVVAEGLETPEQQEWLSAHGCDLVQGFLLSKPVPPDQLYPWLAERARAVSNTIPVYP